MHLSYHVSSNKENLSFKNQNAEGKRHSLKILDFLLKLGYNS